MGIVPDGAGWQWDLNGKVEGQESAFEFVDKDHLQWFTQFRRFGPGIVETLKVQMSITPDPLQSDAAPQLALPAQMECALRSFEARYRTLFDYAQVGIVLADAQSYYMDANACACQMLGYTRDELIGLHATDIVVQTEVPHIGTALNEINGKADHRREWQFRRKDGSVFSAEVIATLMPDGTLLGLLRDLSESKQAHDYRQHLAAIVESSSDAIVSTDADGKVINWNAGAEAIFGHTAAEMTGTAIARIFPHDRLAEEAYIREKLRRGERIEQLESQRQTKDGRLIDVSVSAAPIKNSSGQMIGSARIVRDISVLKSRERELARMTRLYAALSQVNQAIVWTPSRDELFHKVCQALVEHGWFRMAWIGWYDPETQRLMPVAECGDENGYLQSITVYGDDRPEGRGPSGIAFRTGRPYICNDALNDPATLPWRSEIERRGLRASAAFPIRIQGEECGTLHVYADTQDFFHDKEIALLEEAAADVSFALDNFAQEGARLRAERTLRSEKLFSDTMIESMPGILYFYDSAGRFLRWNRNFEFVSGYSTEEIARMHPLDFFRGDDRLRVEQRIAEVFATGESSLEAAFVAKDGTTTPYFFTGRRVAYECGSCLVGMGIDISDRRRAESRLMESEQKYRELVEHANSIILRWTSEGRITFLNEFGQRFFGYTADEIVGRSVMETIVPPSESGGRDLQQLMGEICAAPETFEQNINENLRRNGERVWISWTNRILRDAQGRALEILSIGTDITARKRAETALHEAELRFHTLFEQTPVGVVVIDPVDASIIECNEQAARQLGYTTNELCRLKIAHIDAIETHDVTRQRLDRLLAVERIEFETRHRTKSGEIRDVFVSGRIIELSGRKVVHCVFVDITERLRMESERQKRFRAEAADRIKSAFLATMSHELRTPLNSIIGFTGIILQGLAGPLNPEQSKQLSMVRTSARHLLALVNDVLDISKIEAGQLEVAREPFDLRKSITKVIALIKPQADAKGLEMHVELAAGVGQGVSDERRFEQILLNLLSNAIKFTESGEIKLAAELVADFKRTETAEVEPAIRLRVSDTGMGIKPEDLLHLFQPFRQIDSGLSRNHEGTGLGLAICRRLAALMGGEIHAESQWGKGSTFSVTLPLRGQ